MFVEWGFIDEYVFVVYLVVVGYGLWLFDGLFECLEFDFVDCYEFCLGVFV